MSCARGSRGDATRRTLARLESVQSAPIEPCEPQTTYSHWLGANRPDCGRALGFTHGTTFRHTQPPACTASVVAGSWRQSVNAMMMPPGFAALIASAIHSCGPVPIGAGRGCRRRSRSGPPSCSDWSCTSSRCRCWRGHRDHAARRVGRVGYHGVDAGMSGRSASIASASPPYRSQRSSEYRRLLTTHQTRGAMRCARRAP